MSEGSQVCPHIRETTIVALKETKTNKQVKGKKTIFYLEAKADSPLSLLVGDAENSVASRDFKASSFNLDEI